MSHTLTALTLLKHGLRPHVLTVNGKRPMATGWEREADFSPSSVMNRFDAAPEGCNIGVLTGAGLIVVDVDAGEGKVGHASLAELASRHGALPKTVTCVTRGGGQHLYFRVSGAVKNSVSKLAKHVDIRGEGGQVVVPPSSVDTQEYRWAAGCSPDDVKVAELPSAWLAAIKQLEVVQLHPLAKAAPGMEVLRSPGDRAFAKKRAAAYVAKLEPAIEGQGGHNALFAAACRAVELCLVDEDALEVVREYNLRCEPPFEDHDVSRKVREALKVHALGSKFDSGGTGAGLGVAVQADGEGAGGPQPAAPAPPPEVVAWVEEMQAFVARSRDGASWNLSNPLSQQAALYALTSRGWSAAAARTAIKDATIPCFAGLDCRPDQPEVFAGEAGGVILNTYRQPRVQAKAGEYPVINEVLDFVTRNDTDARNWLVNWMAHAVQNPARAMRTVPVLYGAQRTGKSLLGRVMTTLIGEGNSANVRNEDVSSRFNSHFVGKLLVVVGEAEASDVAAVTSTLKRLTGEAELMAEAKGCTPYPVKNRLKMWLTSNQTLPVSLEGEHDTRWSLFKQLDAPGLDYSERMLSLFTPDGNEWSEKGLRELEAFAAVLQAHAVDARLAYTVFISEARTAAVEASRTSVEQFADAVAGSSLDAVWNQFVAEHERTSPHYSGMDLAGHPQFTGATALYTTYRAFCRASGLQALGTGRFPGELERAQPTWERRKALASVCSTRPWVYVGVPRQRELRKVYQPIQTELVMDADAVIPPELENVQRLLLREPEGDA